MIPLLSAALIVLAVCLARYLSLMRQERETQRSTQATPVPQFTYRHGRTYYGDKHAARMKERAARRRTAALKHGDQRVVQMAEARRKAE